MGTHQFPVMQIRNDIPHQPVQYDFSRPPPPLPARPIAQPIQVQPVTQQPTYYMGPENTYYEEEEEEDFYSLEEPEPEPVKPQTYMVEKTLTVKKPQLLSANTSSNIISLKSQTVTSKPKVRQQPTTVTGAAVKRKVPASSGPLKLAKTSMASDSGVTKRSKVVKQEVEEAEEEEEPEVKVV